MLKRLLEAEPSVEAVKAYAERSPDRWGQLVAIMGRLAGYSDKLGIDHTHSVNAVAIAEMSDMELLQRTRELAKKLGMDPDTIRLPARSNGSGSETAE